MAWLEGAEVLKYLRGFSQRRQNFPAPRRGASRMSLLAYWVYVKKRALFPLLTPQSVCAHRYSIHVL
jgi:hypothetical protein